MTSPDFHPLDIDSPRHVHVLGIGGAGMSAIATVLAGLGHRVTGSDLRESAVLERLRSEGIAAHAGHDGANVPDVCDAVVISTAVRDTNVELQAARARGLRVHSRAEALAAITAQRRSIAVAGSHGKTTTSSMLALVLRAAGLAPSFIIGGELNEVGTNAMLDTGEWLVVEADESDGTFLELPVESAIVTNIEPDHLDHYGSFEALVGAFGRFVDDVAGPVVVCADDEHAAAVASKRPAVRTYGTAADAHYRIEGYRGTRAGACFTIVTPDGQAIAVDLPTPGLHNARNATGAAALATEIGVEPQAITNALGSFGGVARRFQRRGERAGVTFVDDYAHLPTEVAAAIAAAREGEFRRVIVVFQPHRFTRTAALWADFADAFVGADRLVVTDVYAAGEAPRPGVSGRLVVRAVVEAHPDQAITYAPHRRDLLDLPDRLAGPGDVVLTLGAGDLTTLPDEWLARPVTPRPLPS